LVGLAAVKIEAGHLLGHWVGWTDQFRLDARRRGKRAVVVIVEAGEPPAFERGEHRVEMAIPRAQCVGRYDRGVIERVYAQPLLGAPNPERRGFDTVAD